MLVKLRKINIMMMEDQEKVFSSFRPYCSALATKPSQRILDRLSDLISSKTGEDMEPIQEYIVFPMQLYLRTPTMPENYTIAVLEFLSKFYTKVTLTSDFVLKDLIGAFLNIMMTKSDDAPELSEDLKVALNTCVTSLLQSSTCSVKSALYSESMKLPLSHLVFQVLEWAEKDAVKSVILSSLQVIECLCLKDDDVDNGGGRSLTAAYLDMFPQMIPGIATKLVKVLQRNFQSSQSHKIKSQCLSVWLAAVTSVLADRHVNVDPSLVTEETGGNALLNDPKWVGMAQDHLMQHMQIFATMTMHQHGMIRRTLLCLCRGMLKDCPKTLRNVRNIQVEILSVLCVDGESAEIRKESHETLLALLAIARAEEEGDDVKLTSIIDQAHSKLFELSQTLADPLSQSYEENQLQRLLACLHGYMVLLKTLEQSSIFFYSETYIGQLLDALVKVVALEKRTMVSESVFMNMNNCDFLFFPHLYLKLKRPEKSFRHLTSSALQNRVVSIVKLLATYASLDVIVDHLMHSGGIGRQEVSSANQREIIFLLNLTVTGLEESSCDQLRSTRGAVIEQLTDTYLQYSESSAVASKALLLKGESQDVAKETTLEWSPLCLVIEGFGCLAKAAQVCQIKNYGRNYGGHILVFSLSRTDITQSHSAHVLYFALCDIAKACDFEDISALLDSQADFLCRELTILLRRQFTRKRCTRAQGLPTLLRVVMKLKSSRDEVSLRDTVASLLTQLDVSWMDVDKSLTTEILRIMAIFVHDFCAAQVSPGTEEGKQEWKRGQDIQPGALTQLVKDLVRSDEIDRRIMDDEEISVEECPSEGFHDTIKVEERGMKEDEEEESSRGVVSERVKFLRQTVEHTRHFVSMVACPQWQLLAMEIVANALIVIQMEKDELLPLVHQTWQPIKLLFASDNIFVVDKAFCVLRVLAQCAKDFIRRRTLDDVFPHLVNYLRRLQTMVEDRGRQQTMAARQSRKLLREMTLGLWDFMALLDLNEMEVDPIIQHMIGFVDFASNNRELVFRHGDDEENKVMAYFQPVRQLDDDILWLKTEQVAH